MSDIVDRIDELVDEQLTAGETVSDYLTGDHNYPRCPHCGRHWHGLRLTERIASMYQLGRMDAEYTLADDDSRIICEGSEFIGPQRPGAWYPDPLTDQSRWTFAGHASHLHIAIAIDDEQIRSWARAATQVVESFFFEVRSSPIVRLYDSMFRYLGQVETRTTVCTEPADPGPAPEIDVKFGPDNWIHEIQRMPPSLQFPRTLPGYRLVTPLQAAVNPHWADFTAPDYPIPESPGYDFSHLADEQPPTAGPQRQPFTRR